MFSSIKNSNLNKRYSVIKDVFENDFGSISLVEDLKFEKNIILKTYNKNFDTYSEQINKEQINQNKIVLPVFINILDFDNTEEFYYISLSSLFSLSLEYFGGKTLEKILTSKAVVIDSIISLTKDICEAIKFITDKINLSEDLKTSNTLIGNKYNIILRDLININNSNSLINYIEILLPNTINNKDDLINFNNKITIYSIGSYIYRLITGLYPTEDLINNFNLTNKRFNDIPNYFQNIIKECLIKDSKYISIDDVIQDLERGAKQYSVTITSNIDKNFSNKLINSSRDTRFSSTLELSNSIINLDELRQELLINDSFLYSNFKADLNLNISYDDLINRIRERDFNNNRFSGIVSNQKIKLFIKDGVIINAFDLHNNYSSDTILENISYKEIFNTIIDMSEEKNNIFLFDLLFNLSDDCIEKDLNSCQINLFEVFDNILLNDNFNGLIICQKSDINKIKHKYILFYSNSSLLFAFKCSKDGIKVLNDFDLENFLRQGNITINIYKPKLSIPRRELENIMNKSEFILKYKEVYDGTLSEIVSLGKEEVSHCLAEAVKNNIYFDIKLSSGIEKIHFFNQEIDIRDLIKDNDYYKSSLWIVTEFLFLINTSNNIKYFKDLYKSSSEIIKFSILDELKGIYGCLNQYSIVAKDKNDKVIFLARFGNGSKEDIEVFMEDTTLVKKNLQKNNTKELYSAFYISEHKIDNMSLSYYYKNIKAEAGIFNKAKAYVKVGLTDGYNVLLLQKTGDDISLIAPNLFQ